MTPPTLPAELDLPLSRTRSMRAVRSGVERYGVIVALLITIGTFSALRPNVFLTAANLHAIVDQMAPAAIVSFGLTVVLVMGDFDLSIVGIIGLTSGVIVSLMAHDDVSVVVALLVGLVIAVAIGVVNGTLIAGWGASSFVITLASGQFLTGLGLKITGGQTIFQNIPHSYFRIATGKFLGYHYTGYIALATFIVLYLLLDHSQIGRHMYAIGGNAEAARLSGISIVRLRILGYIITAVCSVVAAVLLTGLAQSYSNDLGSDYFLPTYAAVFLGAAVFKPGTFNLAGTLVGAIFLEVISTGLTIEALPASVVLMVQGAILAFAVLLSSLERRKRP